MSSRQIRKIFRLWLLIGGVEWNPGPARKNRKRKMTESCSECGRFLTNSQHICPKQSVGDHVDQTSLTQKTVILYLFYLSVLYSVLSPF